jgi:histo-blood group ABO system transferase
MMRFHAYYNQRELLQQEDYLFACDADMLFVDEVGRNILGKRVATQHPGFVDKRGSYDTNPLCKACVHDHEGRFYFAGGFYGGETKEFLELCKICAKNIDEDLSKGIIAVWHDESHLNRYFIDRPPKKILTPSYCYPESWKLPYKKRLLALDKNHSEYRIEAHVPH